MSIKDYEIFKDGKIIRIAVLAKLSEYSQRLQPLGISINST